MKKVKDVLTLGELESQNLEESDHVAILFALTGFVYGFAGASEMRWGADGEVKSMYKDDPAGYVQIMPDSFDDGFFDWYCRHREHYQFFASKSDAVLHFIHNWLKWSKAGKPRVL